MPKTTPITLGDFEHMSVDEEHRLYWDGKLIKIEQRLSLNPWQSFGAIVTVIAAVAGAAGSAAQGWVALQTYNHASSQQMGSKLHVDP